MLQVTPDSQNGALGYAASHPSPPVTVLMAVHRGAPHLQDQLDSLAGQQHPNWRLVASIDGADDGCAEILDRHPARDRIRRITGPGQGSAANFLHLMRQVAPGAYWAFSDQDDVWLPHKLARAIAELETVSWNRPAMYHSRSLVTDQALENRRISPARPKPPSFANAVVQNIAGGNTIVLNPAATRLAQSAARHVGEVPVHDWWLYQLITGAGGIVLHDDAPGLLYRQHGANLIGANDGMRARARRLNMVLDGTYRRWMETNLKAMAACAPHFTPENRRLLRRLGSARRQPLAVRMKMLRELGIHRQTQFASSLMWLSVVLGRF
ncbi:glycosyltransferase [Oceanicola sp. 502str15]|nr:glycosyltransferase [Oceanicola sp. 502str15]